MQRDHPPGHVIGVSVAPELNLRKNRRVFAAHFRAAGGGLCSRAEFDPPAPCAPVRSRQPAGGCLG